MENLKCFFSGLFNTPQHPRTPAWNEFPLCQQYVSTRSLRRGSKDGGTSKKGKEANGGEKDRVAAVQEEVGLKSDKSKTEPFFSQKMSRRPDWVCGVKANSKLWANVELFCSILVNLGQNVRCVGFNRCGGFAQCAHIRTLANCQMWGFVSWRLAHISQPRSKVYKVWGLGVVSLTNYVEY